MNTVAELNKNDEESADGDCYRKQNKNIVEAKNNRNVPLATQRLTGSTL